MQLPDGQILDRAGTISNRQVFHFAKATLLLEGSDDRLPVVWWEAGRAPESGRALCSHGAPLGTRYRRKGLRPKRCHYHAS